MINPILIPFGVHKSSSSSGPSIASIRIQDVFLWFCLPPSAAAEGSTIALSSAEVRLQRTHQSIYYRGSGLVWIVAGGCGGKQFNHIFIVYEFVRGQQDKCIIVLQTVLCVWIPVIRSHILHISYGTTYRHLRKPRRGLILINQTERGFDSFLQVFDFLKRLWNLCFL